MTVPLRFDKLVNGQVTYGEIFLMKKLYLGLISVLVLIFGAFMFIRQTQVKKTAPAKPSANSIKLVAAKKAANQYDYERALTLLKGQSSKSATTLRNSINSTKKELVTWNKPDQFRHLFFHSLIVDPQKAFKSKSARGYADYMVTIPEFNKIIDQVYKNNYVLVGLQDIIQTGKDGKKSTISINNIKLPKGKKPLILSQDDVSYYKYMKGDGFAKDLFIDKNGEIKNHYVDGGKSQVGNYDLIPIIDQFVKKHPDFSYRGSKGTIALTGYNGVLGYRSSISQSSKKDLPATKTAIKKATTVANAIKKDGWTFASHSWGHINMKESPLSDIQRDNTLWMKEVAPIVGKTNIFIDPFGADVGGSEPYSESNAKYKYLSQQGFNIFCNVDASKPSWGQLGDKFYRNARINVDGIRFQSDLDGSDTVLRQFFNTKQVIDQKDRKLVHK